MTIEEVAWELNRLSEGHPIGGLQALRERIRNRRTRTNSIFSTASISKDPDDPYAFHDGGRKELQFNIGFEERNGRSILRYGVAFSLEPSRTLPDPSLLFPKIERFNYYLRNNSDAFPGFRMWHWSNGEISPERLPQPLDPSVIEPGNFLFLGDWMYEDELDLELVLQGMDHLLRVYEFVEGNGRIESRSVGGSDFRPGHTPGRRSTSGSREGGFFDISLRHNEMQTAIYNILVRDHGENRVMTEYPVPNGSVDATVFGPDGQPMVFYEIKTAPDARGAIREALGQILDYCYWPDEARARELIIVGEAEVGPGTRDYLANLRRCLGINLWYRRLDMERTSLLPPT